MPKRPTPPSPRRIRLLAVLFLLAPGCADDDQPTPVAPPDTATDVAPADATAPPDTAASPAVCAHAQGGVCDEPGSCAFGTDEVDCVAACEGQPPPHLWGACTFLERGLHDWTAVSDDLAARGSGGAGGGSGWWWGTLMARSSWCDRAGACVDGDPPAEFRRYYLTYVPDSVDPRRPAPVVFYLGGFGVNMYGNGGFNALPQLAERHGFILVDAQQHFRNMGWIGWIMGWHVYNQAFAGDWLDAPDVDFLVRVRDEIAAKYNIDRTRVYATGHSRGGGMSILAGFLAPDVFAGFVAQAGFVEVNEFQDFIATYTGRRMAAVVVTGSLDDNVPPEEAYATRKALLDGGWGDAGRLLFYDIPKTGHIWQRDLNTQVWDFIFNHPLPLEDVGPAAAAPPPPADGGSFGPTVADPKRDTGPSQHLEWISLAGGNSPMGRAFEDGQTDPNTEPAHTVQLAAYAIGRDEVHVGAWAEFLSRVGGHAAWHPRQPVHIEGGMFESAVDPGTAIGNVDWESARAFCRWHGGDLPTEAQWEQAARDGNNLRLYPWGDQAPTCARANLTGGPAQCASTPLAAAGTPDGATPSGVGNLSGNVSEWVRDWYAPYEPGSHTDPTGPELGLYRVVRGGSYISHSNRARVHDRDYARPTSRSPATGFRCVREVLP